MKLVCSEPQIFGKLLECVSKFVDKVHFDIDTNGVRIRSVDPDDFCYIDLLLKNSFFGTDIRTKMSFGIDVSKFSKFLPTLISADTLSLEIDANGLLLEATKKWKARFKINFLEQDPYDLPEPKKFKHDASAEVDSSEFSKLVNTAAAISNEIKFTISPEKFLIGTSSGDYSFTGEPSKVAILEKVNKSVSSSVIASYIKTLGGLINKCSKIYVRISDNTPVQLDMQYKDIGVFSFVLSHKRKGASSNNVTDRNGTSLPRLTVSRLPEFLLYLTACPSGEETRFLQDAGLETSGGDYSRMAQELGLASRSASKLKLTREGEVFTNLLQNDQGQAKTFLHGRAFAKIAAYKVLVNSLKEKSLTPEELFQEINSHQKNLSMYQIDKQDLSTLLGLAIWCEIIDRKLALYYLKREITE